MLKFWCSKSTVEMAWMLEADRAVGSNPYPNTEYEPITKSVSFNFDGPLTVQRFMIQLLYSTSFALL